MEDHEKLSDNKTAILMAIVVAVLVLVALAIGVIANFTSSQQPYSRSQHDIQATASRIASVGEVNLASQPNPALAETAVTASDGAASSVPVVQFVAADAYRASCASCHAAGILGAPVFGDKAAWAPRLSAGKEAVYLNAINGKGAMPARGGANLSDDQVRQIVDYIIESIP